MHGEIARVFVWTVEPLLLTAAGVSFAAGIPTGVRAVPALIRWPLAVACFVYVVDAIATWSDEIDCEDCLTGPHTFAIFLTCWIVIVVFGLLAVASVFRRGA